ncbi:MAG: hypothetical protein IPJ28_01345 [Betaproteobacteria bacterium]|nr:hypothetical protein [Betaproteobacteria bacterium]
MPARDQVVESRQDHRRQRDEERRDGQEAQQCRPSRGQGPFESDSSRGQSRDERRHRDDRQQRGNRPLRLAPTLHGDQAQRGDARDREHCRYRSGKLNFGGGREEAAKRFDFHGGLVGLETTR